MNKTLPKSSSVLSNMNKIVSKPSSVIPNTNKLLPKCEFGIHALILQYNVMLYHHGSDCKLAFVFTDTVILL